MPVSTRRHLLQSGTAFALALTASTAHSQETDPSSRRRIRIGQVGTQHGHAAGKMASLRKLGEDFEVIGLSGTGDGTAPDDKSWQGIPVMETADLLALPGLEAVVVETGFREACATAHAAIRAGKHVHLDKPGALRHEDFKSMRQEAEQRGLIFQMGYMLRYNPAFQLLAGAVPGGWLGKITEIDAMMGKKLDAAGRRELLPLEGGGMFELGCHLVDAVCSLMGKPSAVHAFSKPTGNDGFRDNQMAVLEYPDAVATLRCNMADPFGGPRRRFLIAGTEGSMEIMPLESGRITAHFTRPCGPYPAGSQSIILPVTAGRYDLELQAFARAIRQGKPLPWNAAHDIAVHETALKAGGLQA